jgi:hypothetical protein
VRVAAAVQLRRRGSDQVDADAVEVALHGVAVAGPVAGRDRRADGAAPLEVGLVAAGRVQVALAQAAPPATPISARAGRLSSRQANSGVTHDFVNAVD